MKKAILILLGGLLMAPLANAVPIYALHVDTSSLTPGSTIWLDFDLDNGGGTFNPETFHVYGPNTDGTLTGEVFPDTGDVTGDLPDFTMDNAVFSTHTEGLNVQSFFDVFVDINLPSINPLADSGTTFSLSAYTPNFNDVLLDSQPLITIDVGADGTVTTQSFSPDASVTAVPEPATLTLLAAGVAGLIARRRARTLS